MRARAGAAALAGAGKASGSRRHQRSRPRKVPGVVGTMHQRPGRDRSVVTPPPVRIHARLADTWPSRTNRRAGGELCAGSPRRAEQRHPVPLVVLEDAAALVRGSMAISYGRAAQGRGLPPPRCSCGTDRQYGLAPPRCRRSVVVLDFSCARRAVACPSLPQVTEDPEVTTIDPEPWCMTLERMAACHTEITEVGPCQIRPRSTNSSKTLLRWSTGGMAFLTHWETARRTSAGFNHRSSELE